MYDFVKDLLLFAIFFLLIVLALAVYSRFRDSFPR
jgi:hypothetical protein